MGARRLRGGSGSPTRASNETPDGSQAVVGSRPVPDPDAPTVLLYAHYDVQPPLDDDAWRTPPFELTEVDGRWYGRGAADCKGNILMHLTRAAGARATTCRSTSSWSSRARRSRAPAGSRPSSPTNADLLRADAILVCDTGNAAVGQPAATVSLRGMVNVVVTVEALASEHALRACSAAPAPDALAALVAMLATLRDAARQHDDRRAWTTPRPGTGAPYPPEQFRSDAGRARRRRAARRRHASRTCSGRGRRVTVLGIDCPPVVGSAAAIVPRTRGPAEPAHPARHCRRTWRRRR